MGYLAGSWWPEFSFCFWSWLYTFKGMLAPFVAIFGVLALPLGCQAKLSQLVLCLFYIALPRDQEISSETEGTLRFSIYSFAPHLLIPMDHLWMSPQKHLNCQQEKWHLLHLPRDLHLWLHLEQMAPPRDLSCCRLED